MHYKLQELPQLSGLKKIFFVGIKGVGVCPLAIIAHQAGFSVAGSDIEEEFITDESLKKEGIQMFIGFETFEVDLFFNETNISECLVVTTGAHGGFDNPQAKFAVQKGITVVTQGQALALMMRGGIFERTDIEGISVAGAHGKTTITSLLASSLVALNQDPSYSVGTGELFPTGLPGHYGKGKYFVVEADEYASEPVYDRVPKFLYQSPNYAIFNNIDFDHPDLFTDTENVFKAFVDFSHMVKSGGTILINGDDPYLQTLPEKINKDIKIRTFGENGKYDYTISDIKCNQLHSEFNVKKGNDDLGTFRVEVPGIHNAKNALAAVALLFELGFEKKEIKEAILAWCGSKRRIEFIGTTENGSKIFDDYGHHPVEIKTTIHTLKNAFPGQKLITIFQSHTYSRTKALLQEFAESVKNADELILLPVFASQRDTEKDVLSSKDMVQAFIDHGINVEFKENFPDVVKYVGQKYKNEEVIFLTIGAGDVYKIGRKLKG